MTVKLWEAVAENDANVAVMSSLRKEVSAVKKAVDGFLLSVKKFCDLRVDAEKRSHFLNMELSSIKHQEKCFDEASAKQKALETDLEESLRDLSEWTKMNSRRCLNDSRQKRLRALNRFLQSSDRGGGA